jgi:hypothetical protein
MSKITPTNFIQFETGDEIFGRVLEELTSFSESNVIDEGQFYPWINDVLVKLGISYYSEEIAILKVNNYQVPLPKNFKSFYAAYRCDSLSSDPSNKIRAVFERMNYYTDIITQGESVNDCCIIADPCLSVKSKVTVEHYVEVNKNEHVFGNFRLLKLSNSAIKEICDFHGLNHNAFESEDSISLVNKHINTSYNHGYLYLFYHALPIDKKTGKPLIPSVDSVKNALVYYLQYRILRKLWLNNAAPDLERRVSYLKAEYDDAMATAYVESNLPSFQAMRNKIAVNKNNLKVLFQNKMSYGW